MDPNAPAPVRADPHGTILLAPAPDGAAPSTRLAPDELFPVEPAELSLLELQVLHSRVCRQLDREYLTGPDGPHPVTLDRQQDLVAELTVRQGYLSGTEPSC